MTAALFQAARALLARDLRLLWRRRGDALQPALFALLVVVLFALALGGEPQLLAKVAAGVLWVAVLLSGLLALDTLFRGDAEDGSLEQWMLAPVPLAWLVLVRTLIHWATTALPLLLATPLLAELLHLPRAQLPVLLAALGAGHAAAEPARRDRGRADGRHAPLRYPCGPAGLAVVRAGAGVRRRQRRRRRAGPGSHRRACCCSALAWSLALVLAPLAAAAAIRIALN